MSYCAISDDYDDGDMMMLMMMIMMMMIILMMMWCSQGTNLAGYFVGFSLLQVMYFSISPLLPLHHLTLIYELTIHVNNKDTIEFRSFVK